MRATQRTSSRRGIEGGYGPDGQGRAYPAGRVQHPRPLQLTEPTAAALQPLALDDPVAPVELLDPPQPDERGDRLVDPLSRGPTSPASSSWVIGSWNSSRSPANSSSRFAVRPVTSKKTASANASIGVAQPQGEQVDDLPEQRGWASIASRTPRRGSPGAGCLQGPGRRGAVPRSKSGISPNRSPGSISATRDSRPSTERRPIATRPLRTTNNSSASSSSSKMTKLRSHSSIGGGD